MKAPSLVLGILISMGSVAALLIHKKTAESLILISRDGNDGAGWRPAFVPSNATDFEDIHDLDINAVAGAYSATEVRSSLRAHLTTLERCVRAPEMAFKLRHQPSRQDYCPGDRDVGQFAEADGRQYIVVIETDSLRVIYWSN